MTEKWRLWHRVNLGQEYILLLLKKFSWGHWLKPIERLSAGHKNICIDIKCRPEPENWSQISWFWICAKLGLALLCALIQTCFMLMAELEYFTVKHQNFRLPSVIVEVYWRMLSLTGVEIYHQLSKWRLLCQLNS